MQREKLESISKALEIIIWVCLAVAAMAIGGLVFLSVFVSRG